MPHKSEPFRLVFCFGSLFVLFTAVPLQASYKQKRRKAKRITAITQTISNMKRNLFFAVAMVACLASCSWDQESQYTPTITPSYFVCHHADTTATGVLLPFDTLSISMKDDNYILDTVHTNDTVHFSIMLRSFTNNLTGFTIEYDSAQLAFTIDSISAIQHALDSTSVPSQCQLKFVPGYVVAVFPVRYIPRKTGTHDFKLTVTSDSKYSPVSYTLRQPVEQPSIPSIL